MIVGRFKTVGKSGDDPAGEFPGSEVKWFRRPELMRVRSKHLAEDLKGVDWLCFVEPLAVSEFAEEAAAAGIDLSEMVDLQICALSETVSEALRKRELHTDFAGSGDPERFLGGIRRFLGYETTTEEHSVLVVHCGLGAAEISDGLVKVFRSVREFEAARRSYGEDRLERPMITAGLLGGAVDRFECSIPEELFDLAWLTGGFDGLRSSGIIVEGRDAATSRAIAELARGV